MQVKAQVFNLQNINRIEHPRQQKYILLHRETPALKNPHLQKTQQLTLFSNTFFPIIYFFYLNFLILNIFFYIFNLFFIFF